MRGRSCEGQRASRSDDTLKIICVSLVRDIFTASQQSELETQNTKIKKKYLSYKVKNDAEWTMPINKAND